MKKIYYQNTILSIFLFSFLFCTDSCWNNKDTDVSPKKIFTDVDSLLKMEAKANRFSGTVVIGNKGKILYEKAFGIADRSWGIPMDLECNFDIASVNKSMISGLVMIAVQERKLNLDSKLGDLLKNHSYSGTFNKDITISQMLSHTSGLPDYDAVAPHLSANEFRALKRMHFTNEKYVDFISQLKPVGKPGEKFYYSNFAYHLICIILEDVYKMPFGELLAEKILHPLTMQSTYSTTYNIKVRKHLAKGYSFRDDKWHENPFIDLTLGRRVFSTTRDLYKWANAFNDTRLFTQESLDKIMENHLSQITDKFSYGYGWVVYQKGEHFAMGDLHIDSPYIIHGGSTDGYKSMLININNGEWIISMLANSGNRTSELKLAQEITQILNTKQNKI